MDRLGTAFLGFIGGMITGGIGGAKLVGRQYDLHCEKVENNADKFSDYYNMTLQWIKVHQQKKSLHHYFENKGYKHIAIYGMNDIAYAILGELKDTETEVDFCIDRNADNLFIEVDCYRPDEEMPDVDACVVALPELYNSIAETIQPILKCPIVSIEDVIWEI